MADIFDNKANIQMLLQGAQMLSNTIQQRAELELRKQQFEENKRQYEENLKLTREKNEMERDIETMRIDQAKAKLAEDQAQFDIEQRAKATQEGIKNSQEDQKIKIDLLKATGKLGTPTDALNEMHKIEEIESQNATQVDKLEIMMPGAAAPNVINVPGRFKGMSSTKLEEMVSREGTLSIAQALTMANPDLKNLLGEDGNVKTILNVFREKQLEAIHKNPRYQQLEKQILSGPAATDLERFGFNPDGSSKPLAAAVDPRTAPQALIGAANRSTEFEVRAANIKKMEPAAQEGAVTSLAEMFRGSILGLTREQLSSALAPILNQLGTPELGRKFMIQLHKGK
jgi:vacuolar-type H+-ATPase subunit I/STV1